MLKTLAAAVVAASLIAGPALAQGTVNQPTAVKTDVVKDGHKTVKASRHHLRIARHHHKRYTVRKHIAHVHHVKHLKHLKQAKQPAKAKPAS